MCYIPKIQYHIAIKMDKLQPYTSMWMNLASMGESSRRKRSQIHHNTHHMTPLKINKRRQAKPINGILESSQLCRKSWT